MQKTIFILLLGILITSGTGLAQKPLNLANPTDNMTAYIKMRGSLDPNEEVVYYWKGLIYSFIPGERSIPLFEMEAYNIAITKPVEGGYEMLTREVALYRDLKTGEYLEKWYNPFIKDTVEVIHVWNDPVNQKFQLKSPRGDWGIPYMDQGNGRVSMFSDIFLLYPSPLPKAEYPENSRSDQYQAAELFQFFMDKADLDDPKKKSVYNEVGWTRLSDFLPWMRMADKPGYLVYQCRGYKIMGGAFEKLPAKLKQYVLDRHPEYAKAPATFISPNMTSWRYFKKVLDEKKK